VNLVEAVSDESLAMRAALGYKDKTPYKDYLHEQGFLAELKPTLKEAMDRGNDGAPQYCMPGFFSKDRYNIETIQYGIRLWASIGDYIGVDTPVIDACTTMGSVVGGLDYWKTGRTVETCGIPAGLSIAELTKFLHEGKI
jgi:opine dehydrogenase